MKIFKRFAVHLIGFVALAWFLIRVIPKPSRAAYPCQRAAFPLASAFIIWLTGIVGAYFSYRKAREYFGKSKHGLAISFLLLASLIFIVTQFHTTFEEALASQEVLVMNDLSSDSVMVTPKAVVSIIRSDKLRAEDIDSLEIYDMVKQAVEMAGGFDDLIKDNIVVVLKPNLLTAMVVDGSLNPQSQLPEKLNSVTTDYRVIQGVVNLVREKNPNGKVYIIEGSGIGNTRENMMKMGWFKITGVDEFICLNEACGAWRDKTAKELVKVSLPAGKPLYKAVSNEYYFNKIYYEADVLISIPALKTHSDAAFTGAVKNVGIGGTPTNIYGTSDAQPWRFNVISHNGVNCIDLHNWIHDFYMCRPVDFAVMDALTGMQDGPCPLTIDSRTLQKKNTRSIMAGKDAVALDAIASLMVQVDPSRVSHLVTLHNDSLGCANPKYIKIKGKRVDEVKDRYSNLSTYANYNDFKAPDASIITYRLSDDTLCAGLNAGTDVVKAEISVNDQLLDQIIVSNFDSITVKLGVTVTDPGQIKIFLYDKFLNCRILDLQTTDVKINKKPESFLVLNNYPNPFNPETVIEYSFSNLSVRQAGSPSTLSPSAGEGAEVTNVSLKVYDMLGRELVTLVNKEQNPGNYKVRFNSKGLKSGTYLYTLKAGEFSITKKMLLLK